MNPDWLIRRTLIIILIIISLILIIGCASADKASTSDILIINRSFDLIVTITVGYVITAAIEDTAIKIKGKKDV